MFSKKVGIMESNEVEVLAILEALRLFSSSFGGKLMVEKQLNECYFLGFFSVQNPLEISILLP